MIADGPDTGVGSQLPVVTEQPHVFRVGNPPEHIHRGTGIVDFQVTAFENPSHARVPSFLVPELVTVEEVHQEQAARIHNLVHFAE